MKKLALGFLIIGLTLVLLSIGLTSFSNLKYNKLVNNFEENLANISELTQLKDSINSEKDNITEEMIGLIKIPAIDLKYPILEGIESKTLKYAVGHFKETALPGEGGNMTLIGHNNFILAEPFKNLDKLSKGDNVVITTLDKTYTYQISKSYTVESSDKKVIEQSSETKLTLITCTDNAKKRLVVEALLISENANN